MRFLADENFPGLSVLSLRSAGHDVAWIGEDMPGAPDQLVLQRATREARVLLTFDKDFGEIARASRLSGPSGVVLFRIPMPRVTDLQRHVVDVILAREDWPGHFSVVEPGRVRMRSLGQ
jgi:predicted nuclease of predicted toxin-antitoxin system